MIDLVLVGGGLANGLLALRLKATRPDVSFVLLEAGPALGGNHTWSFHGTDLTKEQRAWLEPLASGNWHDHEVRLPGIPSRIIPGGYHSIRSEDFDRHLREALGDRVRVKSPATEVSAHEPDPAWSMTRTLRFMSASALSAASRNAA